MDFHLNKEEGQDAILDFHRFVLLFTHSFSPRIRFVGELELEQAYLDFLLSRALNIRAGMMLVPLGIINERHEPPVFNGVLGFWTGESAFALPRVDTTVRVGEVDARDSRAAAACCSRLAPAIAKATALFARSTRRGTRRSICSRRQPTAASRGFPTTRR